MRARNKNKANRRYVKPFWAAAFSMATMAPSIPSAELIQVSDRKMETGGVVRVATTNVHSWESLEGKPNAGTFVEFLDDFKPDIVCGQEGILSSNFPNEAAEERGYSIVKAPTRLIPLVDAGAYGNFILSKFKITGFEVHGLDMNVDLLHDPQKLFRPRNFIHAELAVEDGSTQAVIVPHLEGDGADDKQQLEQIMEYIATEIPDRPVIVCGDTNNNMLYMNIAGASPPPGRVPSLATIPVDNPARVIDTIRVMNAGDSVAFDYETWDIGSDHLALTALVRVIY